MPYEVVWTGRAEKSLASFDRKTILRIVKKVERIKDSPHLFLDKLVSIKAWKLRIGNYRVIIDLDDEKKKIYVLDVGHRKKIYSGL